MRYCKRGKEPLLMHAVVLLGQITAGCELLESHKLETLALEAAENFTHQPALDTIGLDGDERAFGGHEESQDRRPASSVETHPLGKQTAHRVFLLL